MVKQGFIYEDNILCKVTIMVINDVPTLNDVTSTNIELSSIYSMSLKLKINVDTHILDKTGWSKQKQFALCFSMARKL